MSVSFLAPALRFSVFDPMKLKTIHSVLFNVVRHKWNFTHLELPSPKSRNFRREIEWPEKYTVKPLNNKHLAGRDPISGIYNNNKTTNIYYCKIYNHIIFRSSRCQGLGWWYQTEISLG